MTTISILPIDPTTQKGGFRAISGNREAFGNTAGAALDSMNSQLLESERNAIIIFQQPLADKFFSEQQIVRLAELMGRWRAAREAGSSLTEAEQAELQSLTQLELEAAGDRATSLPNNRT